MPLRHASGRIFHRSFTKQRPSIKTSCLAMRANRQMLESAVLNLISNSIKYLDGSEVRFAITEKDDIILVVSNPISEPVDTE